MPVSLQYDRSGLSLTRFRQEQAQEKKKTKKAILPDKQGDKPKAAQAA